MDDFFDVVERKSSFTSAITFMEQELRRVDRGRLFLYRQRDRVVVRQLQFGVISEVPAGNIPRCYEIDDLENQLLRTKVVLNGEALMYSFTGDGMVVLDNKKNKFCASAAIITFPEYETLVMIGFQPSELPFQYQQVMDSLRQSIQRNYILETRELDLDYVAPIPRPKLIHNFNDSWKNDWAVSVDGVLLRGLQHPVQFSPQQHRFGLLIMLNPLYPTFEYSIYLAAMIQQTFPYIAVVLCVKGATQLNHAKMCLRSPFYAELNAVQETCLFADERLGRGSQFYCLIDLYPPEKKPVFKKTLLQKKQEPWELLRELFEQNDPAYNEDCWEQPAKLLEGNDLSEVIQTLQLAFDSEVPKRQFWAEEGQIVLFGIPSPTRQYAEPDKRYSAVYISRQIACEKQIRQLAEHANVYLLLPGVWEATLKNAEIQNRQLHNCTIIYDVNNLYRIADDIFQTTGNHVFLFDEDQFQVASEFDLQQVEKIIQEHEKVRAQITQQGLAQRQEFDDYENEISLSPPQNKPLIGELASLDTIQNQNKPPAGLSLSAIENVAEKTSEAKQNSPAQKQPDSPALSQQLAKASPKNSFKAEPQVQEPSTEYQPAQFNEEPSNDGRKQIGDVFGAVEAMGQEAQEIKDKHEGDSQGAQDGPEANQGETGEDFD